MCTVGSWSMHPAYASRVPSGLSAIQLPWKRALVVPVARSRSVIVEQGASAVGFVAYHNVLASGVSWNCVTVGQ